MGNCCSCDALGLGFFQKVEEPTPTPAFHNQKKGSRPASRPEAAVYTTVVLAAPELRVSAPVCQARPPRRYLCAV